MVFQIDSMYDAVSRVALHRMFEEPEYENGHRPHWLILNGMLLKVAARLKYYGKPGSVRPKKQLKTELPNMSIMYPDVCYHDRLRPCGPYTSDQLWAYLIRFTDAVIPLVRLSGTPSELYIRQNLGRVIEYLVEKLEKGRLFFYRPIFGKTPKKNGALVFVDLSNPAEPFCLYPFFGLRFGYSCPALWEPIQNETQVFCPRPSLDLVDEHPDSDSDSESEIDEDEDQDLAI